jgi:hypothetical protein
MILQKQQMVIEKYSLDANAVNFCYSGPIDQFVLRSISDFMNRITFECSDISKKLYIILVELLQNISHYSAEKKQYIENKLSGVGDVLLINSSHEILLLAGNTIKTEQITPIREKCLLINSLNKESLRFYKRQQMNRPYGAYDGAHIGLIQVAIISNQPLKFDILLIDKNTAYFTIEIVFQKKEQTVLH